MGDERPIWEGPWGGMTLRIYADGSTAYLGASEWYRTTSSLVFEHDIPVIVQLAKERDELANVAETFTRCALADKAELEILRERLAKLETAVRATGESLQGCMLSHPEGVTVALIRLEELRELVESEVP